MRLGTFALASAALIAACAGTASAQQPVPISPQPPVVVVPAQPQVVVVPAPPPVVTIATPGIGIAIGGFVPPPRVFIGPVVRPAFPVYGRPVFVPYHHHW
jgi:ABC-type Fe3+-hydroxamate transport system substrate-binding protein